RNTWSTPWARAVMRLSSHGEAGTSSGATQTTWSKGPSAVNVLVVAAILTPGRILRTAASGKQCAQASRSVAPASRTRWPVGEATVIASRATGCQIGVSNHFSSVGADTTLASDAAGMMGAGTLSG